MNEEKVGTYSVEFNKFMKLQDKIAKLCKKFKITCQQDIAYNGDLHLQFRRQKGYTQKRKYDVYGIEYAECYISKNDLQYRWNISILSDLKGFLRMSFKTM